MHSKIRNKNIVKTLLKKVLTISLTTLIALLISGSVFSQDCFPIIKADPDGHSVVIKPGFYFLNTSDQDYFGIVRTRAENVKVDMQLLDDYKKENKILKFKITLWKIGIPVAAVIGFYLGRKL